MGKVRTQVIMNRRKHQLEDVVTEHVEAGATLYTDALRSYDRMAQRGYVHQVIDHAEASPMDRSTPTGWRTSGIS